jgi:hypothetical protein
MLAANAKGPVSGSALFATADSTAPPASRRRPIGMGARPVIRTHPAHLNTRLRTVQAVTPQGKPMNRIFITAILAAALSLGAAGIRAATDSPPTLMAPGDFARMKTTIESESRLALAACRAAPTAEREACRTQARSEARVKKADLDARYYGTAAALGSARAVRAKATYDMARARCTLQAGEGRSECLRIAREDRERLAAQAS